VKSLELNEPQNSVYVPSVNHLFVSSSGDGTVKIFDGTTFSLQKTVQLSRIPTTCGSIILPSLSMQMSAASTQHMSKLAICRPTSARSPALQNHHRYAS
jgi:ABC-type enterochelin transport system permease subunit